MASRGPWSGRGRDINNDADTDSDSLQNAIKGFPILQDRSAEPNAVKKDTGSDGGLATAVSVVYITMAPTFSGPVASYYTDLGGNRDQTNAVAAAPAPTQAATSQNDAQSNSGQQEQQQQQQEQSQQQPQTTQQQQQPSFSTPPSSSDSSKDRAVSSSDGKKNQQTTTSEEKRTSTPSTQPAPTSLYTTTSIMSDSTAIPAQETSSATPSVTSQKSGMSSGGKAGIVIGLLVALGLIAGAVFFFWRRRKSKGDRLDDEKSFISPGPSPQNAPRLSLGPSMMPGFGAPMPARPAMAQIPAASNSETRLTIFPSAAVANASMANPFGRQAEVAAANTAPPPMNGPGMGSQRSNPFSDSNASPAPMTQAPSPPGSSGSNGAMGAAGMAASGAGAAVAGRGNGSTSPSNVHRVQLNFQPTMDDELELHAGQVVRIMHEYDDGWALCMRMDRSKQGVVPRTCLSKLPIKPRQTNPPPLRANGQPQRNVSPQNGRDPMMPAPLSPSMSVNSNDTTTPPSTAGRPPASWGPPKHKQPRVRSMSQSEYPGTIVQTPRTTYHNNHRRSSSMGAWLQPASDNSSPTASKVFRKPVPGIPGLPGAAR